MSHKATVDFSDDPASVNKRRLADLPDRVVEGDPHHVSKMQFESPDGGLVAAIDGYYEYDDNLYPFLGGFTFGPQGVIIIEERNPRI